MSTLYPFLKIHMTVSAVARQLQHAPERDGGVGREKKYLSNKNDVSPNNDGKGKERMDGGDEVNYSDSGDLDTN